MRKPIDEADAAIGRFRSKRSVDEAEVTIGYGFDCVALAIFFRSESPRGENSRNENEREHHTDKTSCKIHTFPPISAPTSARIPSVRSLFGRYPKRQALNTGSYTHPRKFTINSRRLLKGVTARSFSPPSSSLRLCLPSCLLSVRRSLRLCCLLVAFRPTLIACSSALRTCHGRRYFYRPVPFVLLLPFFLFPENKKADAIRA